MSLRGVTGTGNILDKIVAEKREGVERRKQVAPRASLEAKFGDFDAQFGLSRAITGPRGKGAGGCGGAGGGRDQEGLGEQGNAGAGFGP